MEPLMYKDLSNKVHLWIGTNFDKNYYDYFEIDYSTDGELAHPDYKLCGFCKDTGTLWYDEDFIGILPPFSEGFSLDEILSQSAVNPDEYELVKSICAQLGIVSANALFWYQENDAEVNIDKNKLYNGLHYIGLFEGD